MGISDLSMQDDYRRQRPRMIIGTYSSSVDHLRAFIPVSTLVDHLG